MKFLKRMKIATRLTAAFLTVSSLLLAIGVLGIVNVRQMGDRDQVLYYRITEPTSDVAVLSEMWQRSRVVLRDVILKDESKGIEKEIVSLNEKFQNIDARYEELATDLKDTEFQEMLESFHEKYDEYLPYVDQVVSLARMNKDMDADALTQSEAMDGLAGSVTDLIDQLNASLEKAGESLYLSNKDTVNAATSGMIALVLAGVVLSSGLGLLISRSISKPIGEVVASANKLAQGDFSTGGAVDASSTNEVGQLARAFEDVKSAIGGLITDINVLVEASETGALQTRVDSGKYLGEYRKIIDGFHHSLDAIGKPIHEITAVLHKISVNDLTVKVTGEYHGDFQAMIEAMNEVNGRLLSIQSVFISMAEGDLSQLDGFEKIGKRSENDRMLPSVIRFMRILESMTEEANRLSIAAANGNLDVRGDTSQYEGKYAQLIAGINSIIDAMAKPLRESVTVLGSMAANDFSQSMDGDYNGAFLELAQSLNSVSDTLNQTLSDINIASEQVASGTQQVAAGSQALSQGATEQASAIEELTASLNEIAAQTRQNALNANQASELANTARDNAISGNDQMRDMQRAMAAINEASNNISRIIKVIDEIAFQTNLLALNAAVEAARAGQHGKGFAVVAEEVRNLAQRSAGAAKETTVMIEEAIRRVKEGSVMADGTAVALNRIVQDVEKASELVSGIAKASNDQASAISQVNKGIEQVSQVTQTNSATAEESAAASEELSSQAALVKEMVGRFHLRGRLADGRGSLTVRKETAAAPHDGKRQAGRPVITLNDREFGKY